MDGAGSESREKEGGSSEWAAADWECVRAIRPAMAGVSDAEAEAEGPAEEAEVDAGVEVARVCERPMRFVSLDASDWAPGMLSEGSVGRWFAFVDMSGEEGGNKGVGQGTRDKGQGTEGSRIEEGSCL